MSVSRQAACGCAEVERWRSQQGECRVVPCLVSARERVEVLSGNPTAYNRIQVYKGGEV